MKKINYLFAFVCVIFIGIFYVSAKQYYNDGSYIKGIDINTSKSLFIDNIKSNLTFGLDSSLNCNNGTNYVGTGCVVDTGNEEYETIVDGDVNGDGTITMIDIVRLVLFQKNKYELDKIFIEASKVNGSDDINNTLKLLSNYLIKNESISEESTEIDDNTISSVKIVTDESNIQSHIGDSFQLLISVSPSNAVYENVVWTSSNTDVMSINQDGVVTAIGAGTTVISVLVDGKTATLGLTVLENDIAVIPTNSLCVSKIYNGSEQMLTENDSSLGYSLTGNHQTNAGSYTITATLEEGYRWGDNTTTDKTFICSISKATPTIVLSDTSGKVIVNGSLTFTESANVLGKFTNSSGTSSVATVSPTSTDSITANETQVVTVSGLSLGSSSISINFIPDDVANYNEASTRIYNVSVIEDSLVVAGISGCSSEITSSNTVISCTNTLTMNVGANYQLEVTRTSSNSINYTDVNYSSNNNHVSVSSTGLITANSAGTSEITITTDDELIVLHFTVEVVEPVTDVQLSCPKSVISIGEEITLTASSTGVSGEYTWQSSNYNVVSLTPIDNTSTAVGMSSGDATISVSRGGYSASCGIEVVGGEVSINAEQNNTGSPFATVHLTVDTSNLSNTGDISYKWYLNNNLISGINTWQYTASEYGTYKVEVYISNTKVAEATHKINAADIRYSFNQDSNTKWVFVNNPEKITTDHLADVSSKVLYKTSFSNTLE